MRVQLTLPLTHTASVLSQPTRECLGKEPADCEEEELWEILVRICPHPEVEAGRGGAEDGGRETKGAYGCPCHVSVHLPTCVSLGLFPWQHHCLPS